MFSVLVMLGCSSSDSVVTSEPATPEPTPTLVPSIELINYSG
jgi:hypothetical protein